MYVSTLAKDLAVVGAKLEIRAVFADGELVRIMQFGEEGNLGVGGSACGCHKLLGHELR